MLQVKNKQSSSYSLKFNYFFLNGGFGKKVVSYLIKKGKKQKAELLVYKSLIELRSLTNSNLELMYLKKALLLVLPFYEIRSFKSRGQVSITTIPVYNKKRRLFLVFKSLLSFLKKQPKAFYKKFSFVLFQIIKKEGPFYNAFQKSVSQSIKQYPKMHFRWS